MPHFSASEMAGLLGIWWVALFLLAWRVARRRQETAEGFTVAGRQVGLGFGAASLLAGWIWALSLYAPAQAGFQYGVAGPLYYSLGGSLMLAVFIPFVWRIRALTPAGHTLPEYVGARLGPFARILTMVITLGWAIVALYFNLSVVGYLVANFSSLSYGMGVGIVALTVTSYSLLAGLKASILTDCVQFATISLVGVVIVPLVLARFGGPAALLAELEGLGDKGHFLSSSAFLKMGLPWLVLSLLSGFTYQSIWQRAWAIRERDLGRAYLTAALGWFPYALAFGLFGVFALVAGIASPSGDGSDITPAVAAFYLRPAEALLFVILVLGATCSTADSALCAFSSIFMTDLVRGFLCPPVGDRQLLVWGRVAIGFAGTLGTVLALQQTSLLQLIFFLGATKSALVVPLLGSLYWDRIEGHGFVWGVLGGALVGTVAALALRTVTSYHNLFSVLLAVAASVLICGAFALLNDDRFEFPRLKKAIRRFGI